MSTACSDHNEYNQQTKSVIFQSFHYLVLICFIDSHVTIITNFFEFQIAFPLFEQGRIAIAAISFVADRSLGNVCFLS